MCLACTRPQVLPQCQGKQTNKKGSWCIISPHTDPIFNHLVKRAIFTFLMLFCKLHVWISLGVLYSSCWCIHLFAWFIINVAIRQDKSFLEKFFQKCLCLPRTISIHSILIKYINLYLKASYNIYLLWGCLYSLGISSPSKTALCQQSFVRLIPYVLCCLYLYWK